MYFVTPLEVPKNTAEGSPAIVTLPIGPGTITRWNIGFPAGCAGLVHVIIKRFDHQVLPEGEGESLYWDNYMFEIAEGLEMDQPPYEVIIEAWNLDDSYSHTVFVGVEVTEFPEVTPEGLLQRLLTALVGGGY